MRLLNVQNLSLAIGGTEILKDVSLSVAPGEVLGLVGESGSGKSMTLLSIMRLFPRAALLGGRITLDGDDLLAKSERQMCALRGNRIGMVFQEPMTALNPVQPIGRQVAEVFRQHRALSLSEALGHAGEAMRRVGLPPERVPLERYPHELSGGQRQRVVIAIAAALGPRLILADEPTTALDATAQTGIIALLADLAHKGGAGLVFVTHDLAAIAGIADRIAIMKDGAIVEEGPAPRLFRNLQHPYSQALLAASALPAANAPPVSDASPVVTKADHVSVTYRTNSTGFLGRRRETKAVVGVSVTLRRGETVAIVGESGSGKSTFARALLGLTRVDDGSIKIGGTDIENLPPKRLRTVRRRIQIVFQDPYGSLDPRQTVERIVAEPLHLLDRRFSAGERRARVVKVLESVGLKPEAARRYPHEFSGGQRQRIAIARALIAEPDVIVLDEAVSALDVATRAQVIALLRELSERLGLAYLFITHDLVAARAIAHRVVVMREGQVVEEGSAEEVLGDPHHGYTKALVAAAPDLETVLSTRELNMRAT